MKKLFILFVFFMSIGTSLPQTDNQVTDSLLFQKAKQLAQELIIVDTHIDLPSTLYHESFDVSQLSDIGEFDYPRAIEGGLNAAFMSIYIPAELEESDASYERADSLINIVEKISKTFPTKFAIATSTEDVKKQFGKGIVSLPMGMENGSPINGSFKNLKHFYNRGIRYITLVHSKANHICDSSYDPDKKWNGLSPFGRLLIPEMNRLGIMVDISHVSDSAFYQAIEISKAPVIASHSSCRFFTPGFERNMNDEMIKKLAENGGVIQIAFGSYFICGDFNKKAIEMENYLAEHNLKDGSKEAKEYVQNYKKENKMDHGTVADVAEHIDHVVKLVGINHVGFGSDFNGVGTLPKNLNDVSYLPHLICELLKKGYSEEDIEKVCSGNIMRVWREVEEIAKVEQ